ncbi:MAG: phage Gp37/Gp68 family protein [Pseudomonadota bacterium]
MGSDTKIQWTDATWNPVRGCSRVSEGCRNCYAEGVAARFSGKDSSGKPLAYYGLARQGDNGPRWTGKLEMVAEHLHDPIRWKKARRIFVNSMSDLFHEKLTDDEVASVFMVMLNAPRHTYQILTKRAERMQRFVEGFCAARGWDRLPPFIWLGISAEDQANFDERAPWLLQTRAAIRFVSAEPLLGPIDGIAFKRWRFADGRPDACIDWVIVGGESGRGARPFDVQWARAIVADCRVGGAAAFVKQLGAQPYDSTKRWAPRSTFPTHGPEIDEWDVNFAVREFPQSKGSP